MAESDFLSFLVDETLKLQKSGESCLSSFELKLSDYKLDFLKGEFIPQTQMLRFSSPFGLLDFPVNWGVFHLESTDQQDFVITTQNDADFILRVFKKNWGQSFQQLLITHADGFFYIVGLKHGDEFYLHDLLNPQQILKAA
jgi:hypothetical protein